MQNVLQGLYVSGLTYPVIKLHLAMFIADCLLLTTYIAQISIKKPDLWCKNKMINSMNDILFFC